MEIRGTTILAVRKDDKVVIAGDGQVTMGQSMVMKHTAKKSAAFIREKLSEVLQGRLPMPSPFLNVLKRNLRKAAEI